MTDPLGALRPNQRRGSKPRCHVLTHGGADRRAAALTEMIAQWGSVSSTDKCMPNGFADVAEAQLHTAADLLPEHIRSALACWWLAVASPTAATPNWDIACQCRIGGNDGLLLIEAKAHQGELQDAAAGKSLDASASANSMRNHVRIGACLEEASIALAAETRRPWALSRDHHYQMSNRFAWAWKLTELGVPVILVYLGFLACDDMARDCTVIDSDEQWEQLVRAHSATIAPPDIWNTTWTVHRQRFVPLIRTLTVPLPTVPNVQ